MKTLCLTLVLALCSVIALAQEKYEVTASSSLNIRSEASASALVLGKLEKGAIVTVLEISNGWAKIDYNESYGFISAQYIKRAGSQAAVASPEAGPGNIKFSMGFSKAMVYIVLALSAALYFIRRKRDGDPLVDNLYVANVVIFLVTCVVEIAYVLAVADDATWFCSPSRVGWLWTIVNFVIFAFVVYNQIMCLLNTLQDVQYNSYASFDWQWGIYSWPIAAVAGIICGFIFQPGVTIVGILLLIAQLVQIYIIFKNVVPEGGWLRALLCTVVYLAGAIATLSVLVHFIVLLIVVLVGYVVLYILGQGSGGSSRPCSTCVHLSGGYCSQGGGRISNPSGTTCSRHS